MKVNQIYELLNDIMAEYFGAEDIKQNDLTGLIAMGETVLSDSDNTDVFLKALVDRIGKTVVRTLDLELDFPNLYMESFEFGAILQKITVNPFASIENASWEIGEDGFEPTFSDINKASIMTRYFQKGISSFKFQTTIPDYQLESAFSSAEMMDNFLSAIITSMSDSMTIALNDLSRTAICNFIAEKVKAENGVVNLLSMYNEAYPSDDTVTDYASALESPTFLRYAGKIIRNTIKYMSRPSALYNVGDGSGNAVIRATARDNMHAMLSTAFLSAYETSYLSSSFRDEYVQLPLAQEVEYWQASGDTILDDEAMATINVIPSSDTKQGADGTAEPVEVTGVVGLLADRQAIGIGLQKMKAGSWVNPIDHYTNISRSATIQYFNDLSENGVVFIIEPTE